MLQQGRTAAIIIILGLTASCGGGSGGSAGSDSDPGPIAAAPGPAAAPCTPLPDSPASAATRAPVSSSSIVHEKRDGSGRVWVVNQDNDSVSVIDVNSLVRIAEIAVGSNPRALAIANDGCVWVVNHQSADISVIDPVSLSVAKTIALPRASQPFGIVVSPLDGAPWLAFASLARVARLDRTSGAITASIAVGANPRHLSMPASGRQLLVSRFISPPLPGEASATPQSQSNGLDHGGELVVADPVSLAITKTIVLKVSDRSDSSLRARGIPNYLGAAAIAPDGLSAWVPSKQDNVMRGVLRDGLPLDFQSTVRAISSRVVLGETLAEDSYLRVDHDNSGLATAAVFDPSGSYLFVALETSRQVALVEPSSGREIARFAAGRAPQGLAISDDGRRLFVDNFMDRTVGIFDFSPVPGKESVSQLATVATVDSEKLPAQVLRGKQFFYDALDPRLALDSYLSCASCHADGAADGRIWDFTGFGEGLRRTISLRGRAGGSRPLHWSGNFDETQDFEGQIRGFAGGQGLMSNSDFAATSDPMGSPKAGLSADLDALSAYIASLDTFAPNPLRNADGSLSAQAEAGKILFAASGCLSCHDAPNFSGASGALHDIGTLKPSSGSRLGGLLTGIDTPALRDAWATGPYLHDGSAATVSEAIARHVSATSLSGEDLAKLSAYVMQMGSED